MPLSLWKWEFGLEGTRRTKNPPRSRSSFPHVYTSVIWNLIVRESWTLAGKVKQSKVMYQKVGPEVETLTIWEKGVVSTGNQHSYGHVQTVGLAVSPTGAGDLSDDDQIPGAAVGVIAQSSWDPHGQGLQGHLSWAENQWSSLPR